MEMVLKIQRMIFLLIHPFLVIYGEKLNIEPELFFSSDIPLASQEKFRNDLMLAVEEWGIYSPVEYWVLGQDISSAIDLAKIYCERRIERGEYFKKMNWKMWQMPKL